MNKINTDKNTSLQELGNKFIEMVPFCKFLGIHLQTINIEQVITTFSMRPEFVGNPFQGILHGGVISSAIDHTGGMMAVVAMLNHLQVLSREEQLERIAKVGTIDLRIDYLRPGIGKEFSVTAKTLRSGSKVSVVRMSLVNERNISLAVGTGTYLIG